MSKFLETKISPIIAFIVVIAFGYLAIYLMNQVFNQYASNELLVKNNQQTGEYR